MYNIAVVTDNVEFWEKRKKMLCDFISSPIIENNRRSLILKNGMCIKWISPKNIVVDTCSWEFNRVIFENPDICVVSMSNKLIFYPNE